MTKLADKIEALEGPSREVDVEIALASGSFRSDRNQRGPVIVRINDDGSEAWPGYGGAQLVPTYTASLDAAMTLADEDTMADAIREAFSWLQVIGWRAGDFTGALARATVSTALRAREASK